MRSINSRRLLFGLIASLVVLVLPLTVAAQGSLRLARAAESVSLDPFFGTAATDVWVYANIYDTLVEQDRDLSIKPCLATSWEQISPTTWRFKLRQGVTFHDGTPFNAEAVKFTFDRVLDKAKPARGLSMAGPISGAKIVDPMTVDISTPEPFGPFLKAMSEVFVFGIVSPTAVHKYGDDYTRNPVGTGPFAFESWQRDSQIVLKRNDAYWGKKPALEKLIFRVIPEASSQVLALGANEIDGIIGPDASVLPRLRSDNSVKVYEVPGMRMVYMGINTERVKDVRVRRALNHAVNRQALADQVMRKTATPAEGYLPKQVAGYYNAGTYPYDPERAKKLLAEAGYTPGADGKLQKDGKPFVLNFWGYTGRDPSSKLVGEAVQGDLQRIGITVNLRIWDYQQLTTAVWQQAPKEGGAATGYDLFSFGWTTITGDADFTFYGTLSDIAIPPLGLNGTYWSPPEYMEQLRKARFSTDQAVRNAAYKRAQELLHENAIWVPLIVLNQIVVLSNKVQDYEPHPVEYYMLRMRDVRLVN